MVINVKSLRTWLSFEMNRFTITVWLFEAGSYLFPGSTCVCFGEYFFTKRFGKNVMDLPIAVSMEIIANLKSTHLAPLS